VAIGKKYPESLRELILIRKAATTINTIIFFTGIKEYDAGGIAFGTMGYTHIP
jgi:hypothetical protein